MTGFLFDGTGALFFAHHPERALPAHEQQVDRINGSIITWDYWILAVTSREAMVRLRKKVTVPMSYFSVPEVRNGVFQHGRVKENRP